MSLQVEKEKACVRRREAEKAQIQETAAADARALQESVRKQVQEKEALAEQMRVRLLPRSIHLSSFTMANCQQVPLQQHHVHALREIPNSACSCAQFGAAYVCIEQMSGDTRRKGSSGNSWRSRIRR